MRAQRRRLGSVLRTLAGGGAAEPSAPPLRALPEQASVSADGLTLLKDAAVQRFIADGFLLVTPSSLPPEFHAGLFRQLENSDEGGNNIMARVPDLMKVYTDPAVLGAARSLVGPGCDLHSHRHAHLQVGSSENELGAPRQNWHKDPFNDDPYVRHKHCFRWVFALYFPQDTPLELGGTSILRGCHNLMGIGSVASRSAGVTEGRVENSAFGLTMESGFVDPGLVTEEPVQPMICPGGSVA